MVRINLIEPFRLTDQHLVAEYNEILMLFGYVRKYPVVKDIPLVYCLGPGHIRFFKNKLVYLKKRHELLKKEMKKRGFVTNKTIDLRDFDSSLKKNWIPSEKDKKIIKVRIISKLNQKPNYYRYYGEKKSLRELVELIG